MKVTRKEFLKIAATAVVAAGSGKAVSAFGGAAGGERPKPAKTAAVQLGMAIDLQKCWREKNCDKCLTACRRAHNVPVIPNKAHEVKWIWREPWKKVFPFQDTENSPRRAASHLPVLCNHCAQPSCVRVCPTQATWKRKKDGIVMMDYHRCIGCRYCMAACPYGARSFNFEDPRPYIQKLNPAYPTRTVGVVEKCNFCQDRLADGSPPACVEACPQKAMTFGDLKDENSSLRRLLGTRYALQRRPEIGNGPSIFYLI
jgi:Fe-S-cluster-containing dehydrogenase component